MMNDIATFLGVNLFCTENLVSISGYISLAIEKICTASFFYKIKIYFLKKNNILLIGSCKSWSSQCQESQTSRDPPGISRRKIRPCGKTQIKIKRQHQHDKISKEFTMGQVKVCQSEGKSQWSPSEHSCSQYSGS